MQVVLVLAHPGDLSAKPYAGQNPFTPKAYLVRYWSQSIKSNAPISSFLLSKTSPMNAVDTTKFTKLAEQKKLSTQLPQFCSTAKLLCFPDLSSNFEKQSPDSSFSGYDNKNFLNYGTGGKGRENDFKNYTADVFGSSFRQYSRNSANQDAKFSTYTRDNGLPVHNFNSYGQKTNRGESGFNSYQEAISSAVLKFNNYGANSITRKQSFKGYADNTGGGSQSFTGYGKNANQEATDFRSYAENTNMIDTSFGNYAEKGTDANETFTSYGSFGSIPWNEFKNYGEKGKSVTHTFNNYIEGTRDATSTFESYGKNSISDGASFTNYKGSDVAGGSKFTGYGQGSSNKKVGFETYSRMDTFKEYQDKSTIRFAAYSQGPPPTFTSSLNHIASMNKWVEPGKFFRESMLKQGNAMMMPDIRDKMPKRSFLPRSILSKLPFSTARLDEMKRIFHARDNSTMERMMVDSLHECERAPSKGETKQCAGSAEDMIDFVTFVLGNNVVVRTTKNTNGYSEVIMIGYVKGINGGRVTKSVSCHQSLYPYLLYYCHSVPKVRVYDVEILNAKTKAKINQGTAICHLDTSTWSAGHGAFSALGSSPGKIEVCHWIYENDMTWTVADN
ncbi:hypothetical protein ACFE04_000119 [Oxalis oulophora]